MSVPCSPCRLKMEAPKIAAEQSDHQADLQVASTVFPLLSTITFHLISDEQGLLLQVQLAYVVLCGSYTSDHF